MSLAGFKHSPWKLSHPVYRSSAFSISPAPEYASSEVLLASLYRIIGYQGYTDGRVPQAGRDLDKKIQRLRERPKLQEGTTVTADTWNTVLHSVLESPKLPNQSAKRFLQVTPLVPDTALFSGSARLVANSWAAGSLIRRIVWLGSRTPEAAHALWNRLFHALTVDDHDDVFARWLQQESSSWQESSLSWSKADVAPEDVHSLELRDFEFASFPARQFAKDLDAIILAKDFMTRRQWTSLLEAILRLGAVSHVVWLCDLQERIARLVEDTLAGKQCPDVEVVRSAIFPVDIRYMSYGDKALPGILDRVSGYLSSRLAINSVLWICDEIGAPFTGQLSDSAGVFAFCQHIEFHREKMDAAMTQGLINDMRENEGRALLCKKGIGSNIMEFARHALGQRQTAVALLRGYDQGFVLKKRGAASASPWVVSPGPVCILALVHCALSGLGGPRSIHQLGVHLAAYGIAIDKHEISSNHLGMQLRMLGLVLDSPDAESGMLLLHPFPGTTPPRSGNE